MSKLVVLYAKNSREVSPGTFQTDLDTGYLSNIKAMAMKTLTFTNNEPNIRSSNNVFSYEIDGSPFTETLPEGYYTLQQTLDALITEIQAQLDISSPGDVISMTISDITSKVSILNTGAATMKYLGSTADSLNIAIGNIVDTAVIPAGTTYDMTGFSDLIGLKSATCSIQSKSPKTILNKTDIKAIHTNSLGVVPCTVAFGSLQTYINPDLAASAITFDNSEDLTQIHFKIRNNICSVIVNTRDS